MIVIIMASKVFKNIYVDGVYYTFLVAILLMMFNKFIKPFLKLIMLPINIISLGITSPFVNVIILKLISLVLGNHFNINGWFGVFFISIFISFFTIIIDKLIGRVIREV